MADPSPAPAGAAPIAPWRTRTTHRLAPLRYPAGLLLATALLSFAQFAVGRGYTPFGWPGEGWLKDRFFDAFSTQSALAFATPLFMLGAAAFGWLAVRTIPGPTFSWQELRGRLRWPYLVALAVCAGTLLWLIVSLFLGSYKPAFRFMFVSAIGFAILVLFARDLLEGRLRVVRPRWTALLEVGAVAAVVGTFIGINIRDLGYWRYYSIGDEGGFFFVARRILSDSHFNWFTTRGGVFDDHPVLGSVWHAVNLLIFGSDIFGWKMGALTAIAITFPVFYLLMRDLFSARAAVFGTIILGASHYLFAYAHTGYNNIFPIFPTTAALACLVMGLRRGSPALLFLCGVFSGLGFYTFYSARATIIIVGLVLLLTRERSAILRSVAWIAPAFAFTVLPLFGSDRMDVFQATSDQSFLHAGVPVVQLLGFNILRSLFAFNFNPYGQHYVTGALMDGVSVTLAVAGLGLAIAGWKKFSYQVLLIWFGVTLTVAGILSRYDFVSVTRLHYALPPVAAFAGVALDALVTALATLSKRRWFAAGLTGVTIAAVAPSIFILNGRQFFIYSAHEWPAYEENLILREEMSKRCADAPLRTVTYAENSDSVLDGAPYYFGWENKRPLTMSYQDAARSYGPYGGWGGVGCVLIGTPDIPEAQAMARQIEGTGAVALRAVTDISGRREIGMAGPLRHDDISPAALGRDWNTDFSKGSGLDGVVQAQVKHFLPSIDAPVKPIEPNDVRIAENEPVVVVQIGDSTRAYPVRYLMWHGVVNDVLAGQPIVVAYDPISGATRVFDRRVGDQTYTFALTGFLRHGNAVLYDIETESWWQQLSGEAITGALAGQHLQPVEARIATSSVVDELYQFSHENFDAMGPQTRNARYARNLYLHYDVSEGKPIFTLDVVDTLLPALQRVLIVEVDGEHFAIPYPTDDKSVATTLSLRGHRVLLFFDARTQSDLDARQLNDARSVGSMTAFEVERAGDWSVDAGSGRFVDGSGSRWDALGNAIEGPAEGAHLTPITGYTAFWFSASGVFPDLQIRAIGSEDGGPAQ